VSESTRNATITMLTGGSVMRLPRDNFPELLKNRWCIVSITTRPAR
jgi:hypothetical protein